MCFKHFRAEDVKTKGQKIVLGAGSVPSIFPNENDLKFDDADNSIEEIIIPESKVACSDCEYKDHLITTYKCDIETQSSEYEERILQLKTQISQLKKNLSKARSKVYLLESMKTKLKKVIKEMKEQKLIDSRLQRELEVNRNIFPVFQCSILPGFGFQVQFHWNSHINPKRFLMDHIF